MAIEITEEWSEKPWVSGHSGGVYWRARPVTVPLTGWSVAGWPAVEACPEDDGDADWDALAAAGFDHHDRGVLALMGVNGSRQAAEQRRPLIHPGWRDADRQVVTDPDTALRLTRTADPTNELGWDDDPSVT